MSKLLIGIDPDNVKSGICEYDSATKIIQGMQLLSFWDLIGKLDYYPSVYDSDNYHVYIEGGHLHAKSNWHGNQGRRGEKIAKNVGMNHQVGILLGEYCEVAGIPYTFVKPQGKLDLDAKTFNAITGHKGKSNQEVRDAVMLVYGRE